MTHPKLIELDAEALRSEVLPINLTKFAKVFKTEKEKLGVIEQGNNACTELKDRLSMHWNNQKCPSPEKALINEFGNTCNRFKPVDQSSSDEEDHRRLRGMGSH